MARIQALLESLGVALCQKGRKALTGEVPFGDVLPEVAKLTLSEAHKRLTTEEIRTGIGEVAAEAAVPFAKRLPRLIATLERLHPIPYSRQLAEYVACWPAMVRQVLRRPSDPKGHLPPEGVQFYKPDDLLLFLPARLPKLRPDTELRHLDDWTLTGFRGLGECSEVWSGESVEHAEYSPAALKFITDPSAAAEARRQFALFETVFDLNDVPGVVPLRAVYLDCDPPCLDTALVYGYDLAGLMHEWAWRYTAAKPEAALKIVRRLAGIVGEAHKRGVVHRDLKPSNVLFHPTAGGKFTVWVTDFGWGQVAAARSLELGKQAGGTPRGEQHRLELRGAYSPLYACPQLALGRPPDPRDDVYALGMVWFQLLKRDPAAAAPVGSDWAESLRPHGFAADQERLLTACLATRPEKRARDAVDLSERLAQLGSDSTVTTPSLAQPMSMARAGVEPLPATAHTSTFLKPVGNLPKEFTNSIGMKFVLVPAGKFLMGAPDDEPGWHRHESPVHEVLITRPFYLAVGPVTQLQFAAVAGYNPAHFGPKLGGSSDWPVESVTWRDAAEFCDKLERLPEEEAAGRVYRLPTETEWEYACRAGESMPYHFGQKLNRRHAHFALTPREVPTGPRPAGETPANAFGLFDMHGNVLEWVQDWYAAGAYGDAVRADPQGPDRGTLRVARGGCWMTFAADCRSAARRPYPPSHAANTLGFRVLLQA
jgi:formylglycine-generating enzyme required for sulfatase activity